MSLKTFFISGIDTDAGKTFATGIFARFLIQKGYSAITQKTAQTGCTDISIDIMRHRELMGIDLLPDDIERITCPYCFELAASPHLSSALEGKVIDTAVINRNTAILESKYDYVLIEGAGGLLAPLNDRIYTIDYIKERNLPLILVSSAKIGSINHTLLSIEACKARNIEISAIIYNSFPEVDPIIYNDSLSVIEKEFAKSYAGGKIIKLPVVPDLIYQKQIDLTCFDNILS